jgi:hypothetical protein
VSRALNQFAARPGDAGADAASRLFFFGFHWRSLRARQCKD